MKARVLTILLVLLTGVIQAPAQAETFQLSVAEDKTTGYNRALFKHWIDADKDGCDTRAEVLTQEAIVKPKIGPKCKLTGGKWVNSYDGKTLTNPSQLDIDHLVPLAEAWRSGAWKWTPTQRQAFANDLDDPWALNAVALSTNRSKGDKDPALWMPSIDRCVYISKWVTVKWRYSLTVDVKEMVSIKKISQECFGDDNFLSLLNIPKVIEDSLNSDKPALPILPAPVVSYIEKSEVYANLLVTVEITVPEINGFDSKRMLLSLVDLKDSSGRPVRQNCSFTSNNQFKKLVEYDRYIPVIPISLGCEIAAGRSAEFQLQLIPKDGFLGDFSNSRSVGPIVAFKVEVTSTGPSPIPTPSQVVVSPISPGAFCSPAGATGKSAAGVAYTCKTSSTDTRNRWRP
jgi:hypothetical protein